MTQAPATPELAQALRDRADIATFNGLNCTASDLREAADALEAQQARIAELEGGAGINPDTGHVITWQDECRRLTESLVAVKHRAADAQALADRYEKALREIADDPYQFGQRVQRMKDIARQALSSSQGRREGGES